MSSVLPSGEHATARSLALPWLLAMAGFAAMYLPLYWQSARSSWQTDEEGHGPIILVATGWLFWTLRHKIDQASGRPAPALGWPLFVFGLCVYFMGRMFSIPIFEFGSQPMIVAGILLLLRGTQAVRVAWFPLLYFIFMIPLPGILVDAITGSLKGMIANVVESLLYAFGYPIARSGVILSIGPYQLQVADACSGLNSMFSLSALGTLFMFIMARKSKLHNAIMLVAILPIAIMANIVRVCVLVLVTYHLGDEAGQGFLHGAAGIVLMLVALASLFALDGVLGWLIPSRRATPGPA